MRTDTSSGVGDTSVLTRRILAGIADSLTVLGPWFLLLKSVVESFPLATDDAGLPQFSPENQARIDEIAGGISRSQEAGGTLYILSGFGLSLSIFLLIVLVIGALVIVPILLDGQTVGKKLFALRTIAIDGTTPTIVHYAGRLLGGFADFFPYLLPGVVGWVVAFQDEDRQRLGDQLGRTLVVDDNSIPRFKPTTEIDGKTGEVTEADSSQKPKTALVGSLASKSDSDEQPLEDSSEKVNFYYSQERMTSQEVHEDFDSNSKVCNVVNLGESTDSGSGRGEPLSSDQSSALETKVPGDDIGPIPADKVELGKGGPDDGSPLRPSDPTDEHPRGHGVDEVEPRPDYSTESDSDPSITLSGLKVLLQKDSSNIEPADEPKSVLEEGATIDRSVSTPSSLLDDTPAPPHSDADSGTGAAPEWSEGWQAWLSWDKTNQRWLRHDEETQKWTPIG